MVRMSTVIIVVILSAATAKAQNYPPFLREAEQALVSEFRPLPIQRLPSKASGHTAGVRTGCRRLL